MRNICISYRLRFLSCEKYGPSVCPKHSQFLSRYSNTLLATLNTRSTIGGKLDGGDSVANGPVKRHSELALPEGVQVSVMTERCEDVYPFPTRGSAVLSTLSPNHSQKEAMSVGVA